VPRSSQGEWKPPKKRQDPVEVLAAQDADRVADLVPVRYGRMLVSPFTFYRGAAAIMAADLGSGPDSGLRVQLCGDAHLSNFGIFEAPDRSLVFDVNDFDETLPGPFEWDLKRLVASFEIAGRDREFGAGNRRRFVLAAARSYREAMREFAAMGELDVWYSRLGVDEIASQLQATVKKQERKRFEKSVKKARNKDSLRALDKLTESSNGTLRIASRPPVLVPVSELAGDLSTEEIDTTMEALLERYRSTLPDDDRVLIDRYRLIDAGHKVVGVGSVGTRCWIALLLGRGRSDPLFLQIKEAVASVLEPFAGASEYDHHGHRVVVGQRLMQAASDILLGWFDGEGPDGVERHFYVRQLWDGKGSAEVDLMSPAGMEEYARLCGWTLARAHARSGDRVAIASYVGNGNSFDRAMVEFAEAYAGQNEADYKAVLQAEEEGRVKAEPGV
jgi:uncharacterized protein (DUF2252 family)